jgi:nucleotide-binding universal stress UspA family protein
MPTSNHPHFQKLLVCSDGSPGSAGAINAGLEFCRLASASLCLLEVVTSSLSPDLVPFSPEQLRDLEDGARARLAPYQTSAAAAGLDVEIQVQTSATAYEGILNAAGMGPPGLIVMGRKGSAKLSRLLMGSVTKRVIGLSRGSVLIVPRNAVFNLKKILVAHDGSEYGEAAWREIIPLAKRAQAEVVAVSVARDERRELDCKVVLQHLKASADRNGIPLCPVFRKGRPFEQIIATAREERVGLVAVGSHGRTGLAQLLVGSVAERVIGMVGCPVLVVKYRQEK